MVKFKPFVLCSNPNAIGVIGKNIGYLVRWQAVYIGYFAKVNRLSC